MHTIPTIALPLVNVDCQLAIADHAGALEHTELPVEWRRSALLRAFAGWTMVGKCYVRFVHDGRLVHGLEVSPGLSKPAPSASSRALAPPSAVARPEAMAVWRGATLLGSTGAEGCREEAFAAAYAAVMRGQPGVHGGWYVRPRRLSGPGGRGVTVAEMLPYTALRLPAFSSLTGTQLDVCERARLGFTMQEIATQRGCGLETVKSHLRSAYDRLGIACRVELVDVVDGFARWRAALEAELTRVVGQGRQRPPGDMTAVA